MERCSRHRGRKGLRHSCGDRPCVIVRNAATNATVLESGDQRIVSGNLADIWSEVIFLRAALSHRTCPGEFSVRITRVVPDSEDVLLVWARDGFVQNLVRGPVAVEVSLYDLTLRSSGVFC